MGIIEIARSGQFEECDDCGVGIEPETDYAVWLDGESFNELILCLKCASVRQRRNLGRGGKHHG